MPRQITIDPITRIEGHAKVVLDIDDDKKVSGAMFKVMDFRGFEAFLQGMQVEMMPTITARICGTCPVTHHIAASRAVDKVYGVTIPRTAEMLRHMLNLGALVSSHAVHFFALAGPDLLIGMGADPAERNILGMVQKHAGLAKGALRLRTIGQQIVEVIGGRGTHPVSSVPGGMASPLKKEQLEKLKKLVAEGNDIGKKLYNASKTLLLKHKKNLMRSLPLETNYLGTVKNGALDFYDGDLRLKKADGTHLDFSEDDWTSYISEKAVNHSYGKYVTCKAGDKSVFYRVGPLARLNCAEKIDTPLANAELQEMRKEFGDPCHQTVVFHFARMIELLHGLEKMEQLVSDPDLMGSNVKAPLDSPRDGVAHVEAPRGVLIHDYKVDSNGLVKKANLLVATQQNLAAIDATIRMSAQRYLDKPDNELLNSVEFGIRCYDPCLSCATHQAGGMKLEVEVRKDGKTIRRARR